MSLIRYYYNGVVHESFLEFEVAEHLDAAALSDQIICFLEKHGLEYKKNLVGQGCDVLHVLFMLCKTTVVLPVSSASCEQGFSTLRLIKTYLSSAVRDKRLSSLGVLSIESKLMLKIWINVLSVLLSNTEITAFSYI